MSRFRLIFMNDYFFLACAWLAYGFIHSVLATTKIKRLYPARPYRLLYNVLAFVLLVAILLFQRTIQIETWWTPNVITQLVSGFVVVVGIVLVFKALWGYDLAAFAGFTIAEQTNQQLTTTGILNYIRHPIYTGTLLFVWGLWGFDATVKSFVTALFITIYVRIGIYFEEKKLIRTFGKQYLEYRQRVPMLLPRW
jgi:methanethiol S-methyltransferase